MNMVNKLLTDMVNKSPMAALAPAVFPSQPKSDLSDFGQY